MDPYDCGIKLQSISISDKQKPLEISNIINSINYKADEISYAIINNQPVDKDLHVVAVISNPCNYKRRIELTKEFLFRMEQTNNIKIYLVELLYSGQEAKVANKNNPNHLIIKTEHPLWHKENMINIGIRKLLPVDWKAVAWIDADLEFIDPNWPINTLKILNGCRDIVQLFSHAVDMDKGENIMNNFVSFGFQYARRKFSPLANSNANYGHCGYAWACTRDAYEQMGGIYELGILGAGDHHMMMAYVNNAGRSVDSKTSAEYLDSVLKFQEKVKTLRVGYIPGTIKHYYHGSKQNRKYIERWEVLNKYKYRPSFLTKDSAGILVPSSTCPAGLLTDILTYFEERKEDE